MLHRKEAVPNERNYPRHNLYPLDHRHRRQTRLQYEKRLPAGLRDPGDGCTDGGNLCRGTLHLPGGRRNLGRHCAGPQAYRRYSARHDRHRNR